MHSWAPLTACVGIGIWYAGGWPTPAVAYAPNCVVSGPGLSDGKVGVASSFSLRAYDAFGNAVRVRGLVVRTFWRIEQFLAGIMGLEDSKYQSYVDEAEIEHRKRLQEEQDMDGTMAGGQLKDGAAEDKFEIEVV